ncbi:alpha/beta hydrolase family esterase [Palleronia sp.]|uniref:extracellular catalytic domain type 1 short-chain-length polyhydroxyalkanoate depolymerase n=1 Tax=Palleronia sp. TaxID=1940284 RepID=UPI0035C7D503
MRNDLAAAFRRALQKTRASDPRGATAIIQEALGGGARLDCGPCNAFRDAFKGPRAAQARSAWSGLSGMGATSGKTGARAPVPEGATIEMLRHDAPAGSRDYRLFMPSPREGVPVGLVLMLHGCTQSPEDFALGTKMDLAAEAAGFVVAYPGQTGAHNMQSCWNWFRPEDQGRDRGEPAILASLATSLAERFDLKGRVHVAGLSAGGAMAAVLAETHPDVFSAAGIHSGLPAGAAQDIPSAFAAMQGQAGGRAPKLPVIVFHGTADNTVSDRNARTLIPGSGVETSHTASGRSWTRLTAERSELWLVEGAGHAWFGGDPAGSYADPAGPAASAEMLRFFADQARD